MINALLYPQNLFYPLKSLKAFLVAKKVFIFEFFDTSKYLQKFFPDLQDRIGYVPLKESEKVNSQELLRVLTHLKNFGEYLRTPENLSYYYLHQELFEETFGFGLRERDSLDETKRAFLVLLLAESLDADLIEVERAITSFEEKWNKFFKEKILFSEQSDEFSLPEDWRRSEERLWNLKRRVEALRKVIPLFNWKEFLFLDTLLITEGELLLELKEETSLISESKMDEGLHLLKMKRPLNEKIGLPEGKIFPKFTQILAIS